MGWTRGKRNSVKWSQRNFVCAFSAALAAPLSLWTVAFLFWGDEDVAPTAVAEPALVLVSWRPGVLSNRRLMQLHWRAVGSLARQGRLSKARSPDGRLGVLNLRQECEQLRYLARITGRVGGHSAAQTVD